MSSHHRWRRRLANSERTSYPDRASVVHVSRWCQRHSDSPPKVVVLVIVVENARPAGPHSAPGLFIWRGRLAAQHPTRLSPWAAKAFRHWPGLARGSLRDRSASARSPQ